ncbi:MAG: ATP-dependent helicase, partial [Herminiimonas sp.]|nr:ATP-dependent helicase [Herminiimonas sp.]
MQCSNVAGEASRPAGGFRPRMTLQTLGRGDGLLGMRPSGKFGPRGGNVTLVRIDWVYTGEAGAQAVIPAPVSLLNRRPLTNRFLEDEAGRRLLERNLDAEADALDRVWELGLLPLPAETLQWRADDHAALRGPFWTLLQEDLFDDFWADRLPELQTEGWAVVVCPGFAHESVPVEAWHLNVNPDTGDVLGKEVASRLRGHATSLTALDQTTHEGSWMLSLGVEIDGQILDVVPMLAGLLQRDGRWRDADAVAAIDDEALVRLRAPGGRSIDAPAAPIKAIIGAMLELLTDPRRKDGPLRLSSFDALRFDALCDDLLSSQQERAGVHGLWQLQGQAGLRQLARRLRQAGSPPAVT